jgi:hypothetical protein
LNTVTQVLIRTAHLSANAALLLFAGLGACSASSAPNPPATGECKATPTVPCSAQIATGGGSSSQGGGTNDAGPGIASEGGVCAPASEIYAGSASCAACVAAMCCGAATSCPNDPNCTQIAVCVVQSCLPNDPSCLPTCEGASPTSAITEYVAFEQCVGSNCPGCPNGAGSDI